MTCPIYRFLRLWNRYYATGKKGRQLLPCPKEWRRLLQTWLVCACTKNKICLKSRFFCHWSIPYKVKYFICQKSRYGSYFILCEENGLISCNSPTVTSQISAKLTNFVTICELQYFRHRRFGRLRFWTYNIYVSLPCSCDLVHHKGSIYGLTLVRTEVFWGKYKKWYHQKVHSKSFPMNGHVSSLRQP
jgi:hypothetical protein